MALVIKKTVDLSSLGEEYEGIKLLFSSIPASKLAQVTSEADSAGESETDSIKFILDILKDQFISGEQSGEKVEQADLDSLDSQSLTYCFQILTGQDIDPKPENESTNSSSTKSETPTK